MRRIWIVAVMALTVLVTGPGTATARVPTIGPRVAELETLETDGTDLLNMHLSPQLFIPVDIGWWTNVTSADASEVAVTNPGTYTNGLGKVVGHYCVVAVNKPVFDAITNPNWQLEVITHELFHCYEIQLVHGDATAFNAMKNWVAEGLARWVDLTLFASDPIPLATVNLLQYFASSTTTLFARKYDAAGFWGHLQDITGNVWARIPDIVRAAGTGSDSAPLSAAVAGVAAEEFYDTWGSSAANIPAGGSPWTAASPLPPDVPYTAPVRVETPSSPLASIAVPLHSYSTDQLKVGLPAAPPGDIETVKIELNGAYGRFGVASNYTTSEISSKTFCGGGSMCVPPTPPAPACGGAPPPPPTPPPGLTPLPSDPVLGVAAADKSATVELVYTPIPSDPGGTGTCPGGSGNGSGYGTGGSTANSGGDPHLVDFHGIMFDFQAVGQYTLLQSTTDDLQIQERQQQIPHTTVAVNTEVAVRDGNATVEVDATGISSVTGYVNGRREGAGRHSLSGGGTFTLSNDGATVRWSDGTVAAIDNTPTGPGFSHLVASLAVQITIAADRDGHLTGLLGNAGVPVDSEFASRDGTAYPAADIVGDDTSTLFGAFGASWRVTSTHASLFRSTSPADLHAYTLSTGGLFAELLKFLEGAIGKYEQAAKACGKHQFADARALEACELDVVETGDAGFAQADQGLDQAGARDIAASGPPPGGFSSTTPGGLGLPAERTSSSGNFFTLDAYDAPTPSDPVANFYVQVCTSASTPADTAIDPALFTVTLASGGSVAETPLGANAPALTFMPLKPLQCVEGWLAFPVPAGATVSSLRYTFNGTISWAPIG
jgi:hypothetical protein